VETRWVCWEVVVMRVELKANEEKKKGKSQRTMNEGGRAEKKPSNSPVMESVETWPTLLRSIV